MSEAFDVAVVGGGIVGLATAHRLLARRPRARLVLVEKEGGVARHQTGHNSGVIHSGIYYRPGSLKAQNCRRGKAQLEAFCREEGVPFETCGKVIVATAAAELGALATLAGRARQNGVDCDEIGPERLRELEPHARGLRALYVREAGIVDYKLVAAALARRVEAAGGELRLGRAVLGLERRGAEGFAVRTALEEFRARAVVNCAGLHADRVARLAGHARPLRIVPFRGEYYRLRPSAERLCRNLIYPVPDPRFPFLGVHFTRMAGGGVECGPNAVLALAREGYRKGDVDRRDLWEVLTYPGFWRLALRHAGSGLGEVWRSLVKEAFVEALQRLVPAVTASDLEPAPAGVRAQALRPDGALVDDFALVGEAGAVHVLNAPSPAATSSLSVGDAVVDACERLGLLGALVRGGGRGRGAARGGRDRRRKHKRSEVEVPTRVRFVRRRSWLATVEPMGSTVANHERLLINVVDPAGSGGAVDAVELAELVDGQAVEDRLAQQVAIAHRELVDGQGEGELELGGEGGLEVREFGVAARHGEVEVVGVGGVFARGGRRRGGGRPGRW